MQVIFGDESYCIYGKKIPYKDKCVKYEVNNFICGDITAINISKDKTGTQFYDVVERM
ncbi:hypothetical protein BPIT_22920 [Candidatus Brocadia pituitae]|nr:hypothetical protein BPIT_22920 [Candidatus Brocadia pituitae]